MASVALTEDYLPMCYCVQGNASPFQYLFHVFHIVGLVMIYSYAVYESIHIKYSNPKTGVKGVIHTEIPLIKLLDAILSLENLKFAHSLEEVVAVDV